MFNLFNYFNFVRALATFIFFLHYSMSKANRISISRRFWKNWVFLIKHNESLFR